MLISIIIGSHGESYLCVHRETGLARAVKIQSKEDIDSNKEMFLKEINILRKIDHPNIIKLHDVFEDSKHYYVVTEYEKIFKVFIGLLLEKNY